MIALQKNNPLILTFFLISISLFLSACDQAGDNQADLAALEIIESRSKSVLKEFGGDCPDGKKVVGYFPAWDGEVDDVQFDKLTHINYSFLLPNPDGSLRPLENADTLHDLVKAAADYETKVGIATGGWNGGDDSAFVALAANADTRTAFIDNVMALVAEYKLDGVDVDWEYPEPGPESEHFSLLMAELGARLHAEGKFLSAAVVALGQRAPGVGDDVFEIVDFLNLMAYDENENNHSSYSYAVESINYWRGRGLPRSKTILGVPFYARPNWDDYHKFVRADEGNACRDYAGGNFYNGIPTIRRKAAIADSEVCGIMFWEVSGDRHDETSLLTALYEVVTGAEPSYKCD